MYQINLGQSGLMVPAIGLGCVRINELSISDAASLIVAAVESEANFFDLADIYSRGEAEIRFGEAFKASGLSRDKLIIQSKTGNRRGWYDFSLEHILTSVENSLKSLRTDYLDTLLLHRPDALMEPSEVAEAFDRLYQSGKVRYFGVSNFNPGQIELLQRATKHKLIVNQVQFSIVHSLMIDADLNVNNETEAANDRDGGLINYCQLNQITLQAWSPFRHGFLGDVFIDNDKFPELNQNLQLLSEKYGVSKNAIAVAWIQRHPAKIQTMVGTLKSARYRDVCQATTIRLTREEWYLLYKSTGKKVL